MGVTGAEGMVGWEGERENQRGGFAEELREGGAQ